MNDYSTIDAGCYVDGHWGWSGIVHLVNDQFPDLATTRERRLIHAYGRGWTVANLPEAAMDIADDVESRLRDLLPDGMVCGWQDGEFYVDEDPHGVPYVPTADQVALATDWHGGMGSMLYAVASTGQLSKGYQWSDMLDMLGQLYREVQACRRDCEAGNAGADACEDLEALASWADELAAEIDRRESSPFCM